MDIDSAGELARHILATAVEADLLLTRAVRGSQSAGLLPDEAGAPRLTCARGSSAGAAARLHQPAILTIADRHHRTPISLMIAGRLRYLGTVEGQPFTDAIMLVPSRVDLEDGRSTHARGITVDLGDYTAASPDALTVYATRAVAHTNNCHAGELRRYISSRYGLPEPVVAGALLSRLDRHGAQLRWVDAVGAHTCQIAFPSPAHDPADLARLLRDQLTAAPPGPPTRSHRPGQHGHDYTADDDLNGTDHPAE